MSRSELNQIWGRISKLKALRRETLRLRTPNNKKDYSWRMLERDPNLCGSWDVVTFSTSVNTTFFDYL
jgi:hypothetical protein